MLNPHYPLSNVCALLASLARDAAALAQALEALPPALMDRDILVQWTHTSTHLAQIEMRLCKMIAATIEKEEL